jgi:flagellar biosynthetic protein FlhB
MPEQGAQEKTEKPTQRRRGKAREQGQVAKSQEINSVAVLLAGLGALYLMGGFMYEQLSSFMRQVMMGLGRSWFNLAQFQDFSMFTIGTILKTVAPLWGVIVLVAIISNVAQVGFMLAPKRLKPDLNKINPIKGFKKFFSLRILVDMFKNIGKLVVVGMVAYLTVRAELPRLPELAGLEVIEILTYIISVCFKIFYRCILAMLALAILDWAYQKYDFEKNLKMSKQEIKEEHKQTEGDPHVRARIRSIQRDQARKRMMAEVPEADVVITNPTHLAVALTYKMGSMDAPEVVAKGAGKIAERIKEVAREHEVPVIEDKPLAQALFKAVEVGQSIPADLYEAVATILAHVYRMKNKAKDFLRKQGDNQN